MYWDGARTTHVCHSNAQTFTAPDNVIHWNCPVTTCSELAGDEDFVPTRKDNTRLQSKCVKEECKLGKVFILCNAEGSKSPTKGGVRVIGLFPQSVCMCLHIIVCHIQI